MDLDAQDFEPDLVDEVKEPHFKVHMGGSSYKSYKTVECDTYDLYVHGASTLIIDTLIVNETGKLRVASSSTLIIGTLIQVNGDATLEVSGSSTLKFKGGKLKRAVGVVRGCSTGLCYCECSEPSDVQVKSWSTWKGC